MTTAPETHDAVTTSTRLLPLSKAPFQATPGSRPPKLKTTSDQHLANRDGGDLRSEERADSARGGMEGGDRQMEKTAASAVGTLVDTDPVICGQVLSDPHSPFGATRRRTAIALAVTCLALLTLFVALVTAGVVVSDDATRQTTFHPEIITAETEPTRISPTATAEISTAPTAVPNTLPSPTPAELAVPPSSEVPPPQSSSGPIPNSEGTGVSTEPTARPLLRWLQRLRRRAFDGR